MNSPSSFPLLPSTFNLRPYPFYKDSGVPWLGRLPRHWEKLPGRACFVEQKRPNYGLQEKTVLSLSFGKIVVKPPEKLHGLVPSSFETYQIINPGDIVVRPTDLQNDWNSLRFGLSRHRGIITSAYMCFQASGNLSSAYAHLLLHSYDLKKIFYGLGSGLRQNLDWRDFKYLPCLQPPLEDQSAIVRFLDYTDRRIRRYIRAKQKLIALLNEQKQAIIHKAVTRGLDPNVRLKPSGVEWLGDVPEHWEVTRLKNLLCGPLVNGLFKKKDDYGFGVPLVNVADLYNDDYMVHPSSLERVNASNDEIDRYRVKSGDIFFVRSSLKVEGTGRSAMMDSSEPDTVFECHVVRGRPNPSVVIPKFLILQLNSYVLQHHIISRANTVTMSTVPQGAISTLSAWVPRIDEQREILHFIEEKCAPIHVAIERAQHEISLIKEYRTRLIADVVTGKLDVREVAARLPIEPEEPEPTEEPEPLENSEENSNE
jgi:type I restriction enzyme S subunit